MTYMLTVYLSQDFAMSDEAAGLAPANSPSPPPKFKFMNVTRHFTGMSYGWMNALTAVYGLPAGCYSQRVCVVYASSISLIRQSRETDFSALQSLPKTRNNTNMQVS